MKAMITFLACCLTGLTAACGLLGSGNAPPPEGWFEVEVPLGKEENAYDIRDLHFLNRNVGWIVGRQTAEVGNRAFLGFTSNGGKEWDFTFIDPSDGPVSLRSVYFFDKKTGVAANRVILFTQDGGESWNFRKIREGEPSGGVFSVTFGSPKTGWAVGPWGAIAKSSDGGQTWDYLDLGYDEVHFESAAGSGDNFAWIISSNLLLRTTDGGATWQEINLQSTVQVPPVRYHALAFTDARQGWVVGEFRRILHTEDGGRSWALQYPLTDDQRSFDGLLSISAYDSLNALAVSGHGAILRTKNGGETWQEQLPAKDEGGSFQSVQFVDADVAYATGGALLMKTVTGGDTGTEQD